MMAYNADGSCRTLLIVDKCDAKMRRDKCDSAHQRLIIAVEIEEEGREIRRYCHGSSGPSVEATTLETRLEETMQSTAR